MAVSFPFLPYFPDSGVSKLKKQIKELFQQFWETWPSGGLGLMVTEVRVSSDSAGHSKSVLSKSVPSPGATEMLLLFLTCANTSETVKISGPCWQPHPHVWCWHLNAWPRITAICEFCQNTSLSSLCPWEDHLQNSSWWWSIFIYGKF